MEQFKKSIRIISDFPLPGVSFKDITPVLADPSLFYQAVVGMAGIINNHYREAEVIVGIESRGFIFASVLAFYLNKPLHLIRKSGKLPPENLVSHTSRSEYAEVVLETARGSGRAVIVDDVLATGGTLLASQNLLADAGFSYAGSIFFINLRYLNNEPTGTCQALIHYDEN